MTHFSNDRAAFDGGSGPGRSVARDPLPSAADHPQLLVSVRDGAEMITAADCGVDIVDLKEPRRGALAPADLDLWLHTASVWSRPPSAHRRPGLSAALGEWPEAAGVATDLPARFDFAKAGPRGCDGVAKLRRLWAEVRQSLDDTIELVAVAYADWRNARCVPPEAILESAIDAGFARCLIDTFVKDGRSTLEHLGIDRLRRLRRITREGGLWWTLAGSITVDGLARLDHQDLLPDCFGLRGDVCDQGRQGTLSPHRIGLWKNRIAGLHAAGHRAADRPSANRDAANRDAVDGDAADGDAADRGGNDRCRGDLAP